MIRLPPTAIVLGSNDIKEYEKRRKQRREIDAQLGRVAAEAQGVSASSFQISRQLSKDKLDNGESDVESQHLHHLKSLQIRPGLNLESRHPSVRTDGPNEDIHHPLKSTDYADQVSQLALLESEFEYVTVGLDTPSVENTTSLIHTPASPEKVDDFHFGGFFESPSQVDLVPNTSTPQRPSPFAPGDTSTPQQLQSAETRRVRKPLPRSPLYLSHNAAQSPERQLTTGLTPRVASRVATHNTPGLLFSQPPRRPPRRSPRVFRHQTNSFSFDSSERSSAAFDQEGVSPGSSNDSAKEQEDNISLHEELRGSSLQCSLTASSRPLSTTQSEPSQQADIPASPPANDNGDSKDYRREFIFSSPHLHLSEEDDELQAPHEASLLPSSQISLPPPFSAVARNVSESDSLPTDYNIASTQTSMIRVPNSALAEPAAEDTSPAARGRNEEGVATPVHKTNCPNSFLARLISNYRSRSPLQRGTSPDHPSPSPSSTSTRSRPSAPASRNLSQTPREYNVYNDALSPNRQPQTPAHLPESRHRSRFHTAFTAPVRRTRRNLWPINNHDGANSETNDRQGYDFNPFFTPSRRGAGRSDSPLGLSSRGFQGLYGGRENGDDERSWIDGVRSDNADVRLWGLRDSRNDERSLNETPEREDWRANMRG